jgi:hypothetical protein
MGDVGAVATLINTVASWFMSPDGYASFSKRQKLAALRKEVNDALDRNDFVEHARLLAELRRLSDEA